MPRLLTPALFGCAAFLAVSTLPLQAQIAAGDTPTVLPTHRTTAQLKLPPSKTAPNLPLNSRERAAQMLNRFTYGPRPGDVERVAALGADKWFEQQLDPASIGDGDADNRLKAYSSLRMTAEQTLEIFPDRGRIQRVADGKQPYPTDPLLLSLYEVEVSKYKAEQEDRAHPKTEPTDAEKAAAKTASQTTAARVAGVLFSLPRGERMKALNAMPVEDRIAFTNSVGGAQRTTLFADFTDREREIVNSMSGAVGSSYRAVDELVQAKIVRSVFSQRQLEEVMTDFWFNHFNIFMPKDADQWYTTGYERDAIRPHVLGKFRDLLLATAQSPAMMVYLDNWLSIGPNSLANGMDLKRPASKPGNRGLNENYGREVMELHTVGVGGGYSQADVTHLSAILTGWTVDKPYQAGPFQFDPKRHEPGTKDWFGYSIDEQGHVLRAPAGAVVPDTPVLQGFAAQAPDGMKQGVTALVLLAGSPKTAHFISYMIAQRFVADEPPPALVNRMTAAYLASDGDIKVVLRTMAASQEFNSHRFYRNKVKTPMEFLASAYRATATDIQNPAALTGALDRQFGEPLYRALPPTGYYITADHWMNTQSLLGRLNFADQLTHNRFANQKFDSARVLALALMTDRSAPVAARSAADSRPRAQTIAAVSDASSTAPGADVALRVLEGTLIGGEISPNTDRFIHSQLAAQPVANPGETLNLLTALLLGSPEFQLR